MVTTLRWKELTNTGNLGVRNIKSQPTISRSVALTSRFLTSPHLTLRNINQTDRLSSSFCNFIFWTANMTSTTSSNQVAKARPTSEGLLNKKWDHCLANLLVKSTLGAGFGIIFSVLLFKRRTFPAWVGLGFGAGRGYAECDREFKGAAGGVTKAAGERLQRPS